MGRIASIFFLLIFGFVLTAKSAGLQFATDNDRERSSIVLLEGLELEEHKTSVKFSLDFLPALIHWAEWFEPQIICTSGIHPRSENTSITDHFPIYLRFESLRL